MSETVTLEIPADTAYVSVARSVAAAMSARADLTIDQLEDVRLAVDEALTQAIADAAPASTIRIAGTVQGQELAITVESASVSGRTPSTSTFSWVVMHALVDEASAAVDGGRLILALRITGAVPVGA